MKLMLYAKIILENIRSEFRYLRYLVTGEDNRLDVRIMSVTQTMEYIDQKHSSIIRYGDGELMVMNGKSLPRYQAYDETLGRKLREIAAQTGSEDLLICMPEPIGGVQNFVRSSQRYWISHMIEAREAYKPFVDPNATYGNSFIFRPYLLYRDKEPAKNIFLWIKKLVEGKRLVLIEGRYSRGGVGNDLFAGAASITRILCPNRDAYAKIDEIMVALEPYTGDRDALFLTSVGPAAKLIAYELYQRGCWVLDIGHIDSEYEWYLSGATKRTRIPGKHTAEMKDDRIEQIEDAEYLRSIAAVIE